MRNQVSLDGRLTRDPEMKSSRNGTSVCQFTLAVERDYKQEGQPEVDFINCVVFGKRADVLAQYKGKGDFIGIDGRIQTGEYTDREGKTVKTTSIAVDKVHLHPGGKNQAKASQYARQGQSTTFKAYAEQPSMTYQDADGNEFMPMADDMPF